jgi:inhibitor of cysteine peptidase
MTTAASDAQKVISAQVNKPFTIVLESNPTTGYSWQAEFDPEYLKLSQSRYERPSSSLLGAGGRQVFVFVPRRSGKTVIEMRYKRKWEPAPVKVKRFAVVVSHEGSFHGDGVRWTEIRNTDEEVCTCASGTYLLTKRDRFDRLYHSPGRIGLTLTPS